MKLLIILLIWMMIGLAGCNVGVGDLTLKQPCQNITIEKNITVEVIKEINVTQWIQNITIVEKNVTDLNCQKERIKIISQLDYTRDNLDDCMRANSTTINEDLQENLSNCYRDARNWNDTFLAQITNLNNTIIHLRNRLNESNVTE